MDTMKRITLLVMVMATISCSLNQKIDTVEKVQEIAFAASVYTIAAGEVVTIPITVEPSSARETSTIKYSAATEGIVQITQTSKTGIVVTGLKEGRAVLLAEADGIMATTFVDVKGSMLAAPPYITISSMVVSIKQGERKTVSAGLFGGTPIDNTGFTWFQANERVVSTETTSNIAVITGVESGITKITVSHPKAEYSVDIIAIVGDTETTPPYLTSTQNVVTIDRNITATKTVMINIVGGSEADETGIVYQVIEGANVVSLQASGDTCQIQAAQNGTAKIRVTHPKAAYPMEIVVIALDYSPEPIVELDSTIVLLDGSIGKLVTASIIGQYNTEDLYSFVYEIDNPEIVGITQINNTFYLKAIKSGTTVVRIINTNTNSSRSLLVIAGNQDENTVSNELYITTNQNVIYTQVGNPATNLSMKLIGGTAGDNDFEWIVENSAIVGVTSPYGTVTYTRALAKTLTTKEVVAYVQPTAAGSTYITIRHPKAKNEVRVLIKVYPKGTFADGNYSMYAPSPMQTIEIGQSKEIEVKGNEKDIQSYADITWSMAGSSISCEPANAKAVITGISTGYTTVTVSSTSAANQVKILVYAGTQEEIINAKYISLSRYNYDVELGDTVYIDISENNIIEGSTYKIAGEGLENVEAQIYGKVLVIKGVTLGTSILTITNTGADNSIQASVKVRSNSTSLATPYYVSASKSETIVIGRSKIASATLSNASPSELTGLVWTTPDNDVISITANGSSCTITALKTGQAIVYIGHPKSENRHAMIVFVVATEADIEGKLHYSLVERNYNIREGESILVNLLLDGDTSQETLLEWGVDNTEIISTDSRGGKVFIQGNSPGNAIVSVKHPVDSEGIKIYVTVYGSSETVDGRTISLQPILEMYKGQQAAIAAYVEGYSDSEISAFRWTNQSGELININGRGKAMSIIALESGIGKIVFDDGRGTYTKEILVIVYNSPYEVGSSSIVSMEKNYVEIQAGNTLSIKYVVGQKGCPENMLESITVNPLDTTVVDATGTIEGINILALAEGYTNIEVTIPFMGITCNIYVLVKPRISVTTKNNYTIETSNIYKTVKGQLLSITPRLLDKDGIHNEMEKQRIIWEAPESSGYTFITINGDIRINALEKGSYTFNAMHPETNTQKRTAVYVYENSALMDSAYPLYVEKENNLARVGDTIQLTLVTPDDDIVEHNRIVWTVPTSGIIEVLETNGKTISIRTINGGSATIVANHPNAPSPVAIRVYVSTAPASEEGIKILTENIIGIATGSAYTTSIQLGGNIQQTAEVTWQSENNAVVTVVGQGTNAVLQGVSQGQTAVVVRIGTEERKILVYVRDNQAEIATYKAFNLDRRVYRIKEGEKLQIKPYQYPSYIITPYTVEDLSRNGVSKSVVQNGTITITGLKQGLSIYRIKNTGASNTVDVSVVVTEGSGTGDYVETPAPYLTASNNVLLIESTSQGKYLNAEVVGTGQVDHDGYVWQNNNPELISLTPSGPIAYIVPHGAEGTATIMLSNADTANILNFTVIIGSETTLIDDSPTYVYLEKTVIRLKTNAPPYVLLPLVKNSNDYKTTDFVIASTTNGSFTAQKIVTNGTAGIIITPQQVGQGEITVSHPAAEYPISASIIVSSDGEDAALTPYLTTDNNYVEVEIGSIKTISVAMVGYNETYDSNYTWSNATPGVAEIVGAGSNVNVLGLSLGVTTITVRNTRCPYPLSINVRVVDGKAFNQALYITSNRNVIETIADGMYTPITVTMVGASVSAHNSFQWSIANSNIAEVIGSGTSAMLKSKAPGTTKITISHPEASNDLQLVLIVGKNDTSGIYIEPSETIITAIPGSTISTLAAKLIGGTAVDNAEFKWSIYNQNPTNATVALNNGSVIAISANYDKCNINTYNEGIAFIRVSHPKASRSVLVSVYVQPTSTMKFTDTVTTLVKGENTFAGINIPVHMSYYGNDVLYSTDNTTVCTVTGTNKVALISPKNIGNAIITARMSKTGETTQLAVNVIDGSTPGNVYIGSSTNTILMNPRSQPIVVNAFIGGTDISISDSDDLMWVIGDNSIATITPTHGIGKDMQIAPVNAGETTLTISHSKSMVKKVVFVKISEPSNAFSLSPTIKTVNLGQTTDITSTIVDGSSGDYASIQWDATKKRFPDGTYGDIVRIMGDGKSITLYPVEPGTTEVSAYYAGYVAKATIIVESQYEFSFETRSVQMYPGQVFNVGYNLKPAGSNILIHSTDAGSPTPVVTYNVNEASRSMQIVAQREGNATITGVSNAMTSPINIKVAYNYQCTGGVTTPQMSPADTGKFIPYSVYPPNTTIKQSGVLDGVLTSIGAPDAEGNGKIYINTTKEVDNKVLTFIQYKPDGTTTGKSFTTAVYSLYLDEAITPSFFRVNGYWSNGTDVNWNTPGHDNNETLTSINGIYRLTLGDGEDHLLLLNKKYSNSTLSNIRVTGDPGLDQYMSYVTETMPDGSVAIRVKSKEDVIDYTRFGFNHDVILDFSEYLTPNVLYATSSIPAGTLYATAWYNVLTGAKGNMASETWKEGDIKCGLFSPLYPIYNGYSFKYVDKNYTVNRLLIGRKDNGNVGTDNNMYTAANRKTYLWRGENHPYEGWAQVINLTYAVRSYNDDGVSQTNVTDAEYTNINVRRTPRTDILVLDTLNRMFMNKNTSGDWRHNYDFVQASEYIKMPAIDTTVVNADIGYLTISYERGGATHSILLAVKHATRKCHSNFNPNKKYVNQDGNNVLFEPRGAY